MFIANLPLPAVVHVFGELDRMPHGQVCHFDLLLDLADDLVFLADVFTSETDLI